MGKEGDAAAIASAGAEVRKVGDYLLKETIGAGSQGEVYRAEQAALGRDAVVKILRMPEAPADDLKARFLREAQIASRLDHPYAAHVYAFGADGDTLWIAMEYVRGTSMADFLAQSGPMPPARFVPVFERLCQVVHSAHEQGIIHRDIKPANVMMVSRAGRLLPKLLDLGIARLADAPVLDQSVDLTSLSTVAASALAPLNLTGDRHTHIGTPHYMAPEQWVDPRQVDARTDVYALGVLAYEMLSGRRPFTGASLIEVARAHARKAVPPLEGGLPPELDAVLARAMAKRAADRFATPLEMAEALRRAAAVEAEDADELPALPVALREMALTLAPAPIAEGVALVEAARTPRQLAEALALLARAAVRFLGACALAARAQVGPGAGEDTPEAAALLARLRRGALDDAGWLALARALTAPFAAVGEAHPLPPLVRLLNAADRAPLDELATVAGADAASDPAPLVDAAGRGLSALTPLYDVRLAVVRGGRAELWVGSRRGNRAVVRATGDASDGDVVLLDGDDHITLSLAPLAQRLAPSPGADEELFFLDGDGRFGARLVAHPLPYERFDEGLWPALGEAVPALRGADAGAAHGEAAPYRGLAPFTAEDADAFVGREREVEAFGNRLRMQGLIAVVGPSGAGKSSFIQAGVLPSLPAGWRSLVMRPGADPFGALAARWAAHGHLPALSTDQQTGAAVGAAIARAATAAGGVLVLVIDQFEEIFTLTSDAEERVRFAAALSAAAAERGGPVRVVLTLRDDFLLRAQALEPLRHRLAHGLELLTTPARADLLRILREPARRSGYDFEDDALPVEMVAAVEDVAGALPLLSFTASRLWELRDRRLRRLTRRAHDALGGVGGALGQHAEATLDAMPAAQRDAVREVFRHLVTSAGTRAVMTRRDLEHILGDDAGAVLEALIHARLLVGYEGDGGAERIEIIHEALLGSWPRLVTWRGEDAEHARMREQLRAAARQWLDRGRASGLLWRGDALAEYRRWRQRYQGRATPDEEQFARASLAADRRARRLRRAAIAAVLTASLASTIVFAGLRRESQARAAEARARVIALHQEQGRQELLGGRPARAAAYLSTAYAAGGDQGQVRFLLGRALDGLRQERARFVHGSPLRAAALSAAGDLVLTGGADGSVRLWSSSGEERARLPGHKSMVTAIAFDATGARAVTGDADGLVQVWDVAAGRAVATLELGALIKGLLWLAPGDRLLVAARNGRVAIWRPGDARPLVEDNLGEANGIGWVGVSASERIAAAASREGTLRLYALPGLTPIATVRAHEDAIWAGAFSADDRLLVTGSEDWSAALWDLPSLTLRARLVGHAAPVLAVDLDAAGTRVATGGRDATARLWDAATGKPMIVFTGHRSAIESVELVAETRRLVTASLDGSVRTWSTESGGVLGVLDTHPGEVWLGVLSRDESTLLTAGLDGESRLFDVGGGALVAEWDAPAGREIASAALLGADEIAVAAGDAIDLLPRGGGSGRRIASLPGPIVSVRASPDGGALVATTDTGTVRVLGRDGALRAEMKQDGHVQRALFSPDGRLVLTASATGDARLWHAGGAEACRPPRHEAMVSGIAWSGDGRLAASGGDDAVARVWRAADCREVRRFALADPVNALALDERGELLVAGLESGEIALLSVATGRELARAEGHADILTGLALSSDGQRIASVARDGTLSLWDARSGALLSSVAAHGEEAIDLAFAADGESVLTAGPTHVRLWRLDRETRSPTEVARAVDCSMPLVLEGDSLVANHHRRCPGASRPGAAR